MPAKKDNKKKGKDEPLVVDPTNFLREATPRPLLGGVSALEPSVAGDFFNVEEIFEEWNVDEVWSEVGETLKNIKVKYPNNILCAEQKSVIEMLGLPVEQEGDAKKGAKKKAVDIPLEDNAVDEEGRLLPRVYIGSESAASDPTSQEYLSYSIETTFRCMISKNVVENHEPSPTSDEVHNEPPEGECSTGTPVEADARNEEENNIEESPEESTEPIIQENAEFDPLMCAAFRLVAQYFQSSLTNSADSDAPFLWRAIYPQNAAGKPCWNKSGKYCVKLFLAGKWRKVPVFDCFPVQNNEVTIASSSNAYELWPSILAKAVYTVYTACGYHNTLNIFPPTNENSPSDALNPASFVGFALHVMTGWLPCAPWNLIDVCTSQTNRIILNLEEITFGGAMVVKPDCIPSQEAVVAIQEDQSQMNKQRTKKQLKDLLRKKKLEKENLIRAVVKREELIDTINQSVATPFSEAYYIYRLSLDGTRQEIYPILAICYPEGEKDLIETQLLIKWKVFPMTVGENPDPDPDIPGSRPVEYQWISIRELCCEYYVYVCGLDTRLRTNQCAEMGWHWECSEKSDDGAKGKGKAKAKDKKAAVTPTMNPIGVPYEGVDRGVFPPMLLRIQPKVQGPSVLENSPTAETDLVEPCTEQLEMNSALGSSHYSLSVSVQADVVSLAPNADKNECGAESTEVENSENSDRIFGIIDDAILVLQEIRVDKEEPLVMRVQLCASNPLPMARTTFNIPMSRMPNESVLFRVRLFTKSSCRISFHCPDPIEILEASQVWENSGGVARVFEGSTQPTHAKTEQILFRIPLKLSEVNGSSTSDFQDESAFFFVHTSDRAIYNTLSLVAIDDETHNNKVLPLVNENCFQLHNSRCVTVVGRCYHSTMNVPEFSWKAYALTRRPLVAPEEIIPYMIPEPPGQRFTGEYAANNKLCIFKDVISADTNDFPLAFRISTHRIEDVDDNDDNVRLINDSSPCDVNEHLWFTARMYRKSDRQLVGEYNARSILQLYMIDKTRFLDVAVAEGEQKTEKSTKSKADKKSGKASDSDVLEFILELIVDENRMHVPDEWRSRYPFQFRRSNTSSELGNMDGRSVYGAGLSNKALFKWQLDVLAGKIVKMQHDLYNLERYTAMKNKWDEVSSGRRSRAQAAKTFFDIRLGRTTADQEHSVDGVPELAEALEKSEESIADREKALQSLPEYKEFISKVPDGQCPELLSAEVVQMENDFAKADMENASQNAKESLDSLTAFNDKMRATTLERIDAIRGLISANYGEAIEAWNAREAYKLDIEKKNEALKYMLQRASEALVAAFPDEYEDPKAKKGAKGKKK
mmetsp:Transcript_20842/g.29973  ORF Transcript_20842/g.29973 Transcript_20842/m.29973 type:complete len:1324 (+) Transcript_20842:101-4072(+)|eukprot:CAMPEP_0185040150 /NCGR_PEP_ID=MMETSP1103-20130426/37892_1 /TAXON_ID=36769 /ORGANISM="Paraphysomonas bandaiensis, Strain Caron Lab Isolate" /LENGTH=1323 /DNA_ID=CAMNT_0027579333 /DNA_START=56 /DNA_END=4027 /DNA_ORIENTATION=-